MPPQTLSQYFSGMPNLGGVSTPATIPSLSDWENNVLRIVKTRWPTSSLEIAEFLGHECTTRDQKRLLSSRVVYHVKKLVEKKHVMSKRFGNALIVWPYEVETLRIMHEMMDAKPVHHLNTNHVAEKNISSKTHPSVHPIKKSIWKGEH